MAQYTASGKALATGANTNVVELRAAASDVLRLREIWVFAEAATALNLALFRTTVVGTAGTAVAASKYLLADGAPAGTVVTGPTAGTLEAQPLSRAFLPAVAGSAVVFTWSPGFEPMVAVSTSLMIRNDGAAGPAITWRIVWDE